MSVITVEDYKYNICVLSCIGLPYTEHYTYAGSFFSAFSLHANSTAVNVKAAFVIEVLSCCSRGAGCNIESIQYSKLLFKRSTVHVRVAKNSKLGNCLGYGLWIFASLATVKGDPAQETGRGCTVGEASTP